MRQPCSKRRWARRAIRLITLTLTLSAFACAGKRDAVKRIGILQFTRRLDQVVEGVKQGLADLGYVEGRNITYLYRNAEANPGRIAGDVDAMLDAHVDLIVALTTPVATIVKERTDGAGIPVIFTMVSDPVEAGLVADPAQPGGYITGVMDGGNRVAARKLEILREIDPHIKRVLVVHSDTKALLPGIEALRRAAPGLGIDLRAIQINTVDEVRAAYARVPPGSIDAVFVPSDVLVIQGDDALMRLLKQMHIPAIGDEGNRNAVIGYGPPLSGLARQTAVMVAKVLKGADPGTLPVELPRQYRLTLSLRNAKTVGYRFLKASFALADAVEE